MSNKGNNLSTTYKLTVLTFDDFFKIPSKILKLAAQLFKVDKDGNGIFLTFLKYLYVFGFNEWRIADIISSNNHCTRLFVNDNNAEICPVFYVKH